VQSAHAGFELADEVLLVTSQNSTFSPRSTEMFLRSATTLLLPINPRWAERHNEQRRRLLTMDFRTFLQALIEIPCQIVSTGRRVRWRILAYNQWLEAFFRLLDAL
jgi:hypothetical protein